MAVDDVSYIFIIFYVMVTFAQQSSQTSLWPENERDQCPDTLKPEGINPYKMGLVLTPAGDEITCCGLNPGFYYTGPCNPDFPSTTQYLLCPTGTFMDEKVHFEPRCKPHSNCPIHYGVKGPGNSTDDTECEKCQPGFDSLTNSRTESCTEIGQPNKSDHRTTTDDVDGESKQKPKIDDVTVKSPVSTENGSEGQNLMVVLIVLATVSVILIVALVVVLVSLAYKYKERGKRIKMLRNSNQTSRDVVSSGEISRMLPRPNREPDSSYSTMSRNYMESALSLSPRAPPRSTVAIALEPLVVVRRDGQLGHEHFENSHLRSSTADVGTQTEYSPERKRKMYDMGCALADVVHKNDIDRLFRKLTIHPDPDVEINNIEGPEIPREKFIRLFRILIKHGEAFVNPQRIADVCQELALNTYASLVKNHFPDEVCLEVYQTV
ncbi:uncharacterized protein LOC143463144 isoform X1 [Clavelina lepadiformis]|uniref:uncharacterized protein LOC143463144 isoform X1 n=2 Tax=Clavelina lepadiformis TaxID=159417 RepID=UPI0040430A47